MSAASRRWRLVLVGAVVAGLFVVPAQAFASGSISPKAKKAIRAQLRKTVKKNPGVLRHRSFLKKAALVNFKLPVTIRLRNPCTTENGANPAPTVGGNPVGVALSTNCLTQGTALNERTVPSATVNLGPSLGTASDRGRRLARGGRRVQRHVRRRRTGQRQHQAAPVDQALPQHVVRSAAVERRLRGSDEAQRRELPEGDVVHDRPVGDRRRAGLRRLREHDDVERRPRCRRATTRCSTASRRRSRRRVPDRRRHSRVPVLRPGRARRARRPRPATSRTTRALTRSTRSRPAASSATTTGSAPTRTRSRPARRRRTRATRPLRCRSTTTRPTRCCARTRCDLAIAPGRHLGEHERRHAGDPRRSRRPLRARRTSRSATPVARRTCSGTSRARTSASTSP